ncbi:GTP 3',8-cyclase MoaA [Maridesulfovibrio hydrothermalis]|uniref:GTP 3',8-cyclase n=1 Tax=Maridesulfovibrio hydrothermalis AM13 = DSM 14728 TaxID=1121451 RepID=L0RGL4_9BACT|nr:GTP 3',8-cyclase MoaA [Maridesulfovibrio hydrothermalis]CCO25372.1 Molybdenum cofactor biosynthesis protein A [Maridesulfovibrio hydrothermalis AM13 = DSM 14728]
MILTDKIGRDVSYLRLSVTDRCNLRCVYCVTKDFKFIPHPEILRYEEMLRLIDLAATMNIKKLRLTGGEPFARRGFMGFVAEIMQRHEDMDLRITTNGTTIESLVPDLKKIGVKRLNISLDTLDRKTFEEVTGKDHLDDVLNTISACLSAGIKVKINAVAMKGVNDKELGSFINFAKENPLDMRFIEFMPMGDDTKSDNNFWSADEILEQGQQFANLIPVKRTPENRGPARMYTIEGGKGRLGLISPVSSHFCGTCNRLRITSDGHLRTCLFSDKTYRLRNILRNPALGDDFLLRVIAAATRDKPLGYHLLESRSGSEGVCETQMSAIGG